MGFYVKHQKAKTQSLWNRVRILCLVTTAVVVAVQVFSALNKFSASAVDTYDIYVATPTPAQGKDAETSSIVTNGTVSISPATSPNNPIAQSAVAAGQNITITATPNRGYEFSTLSASTSAVPQGPGRKITRSGIGTININDERPIFLTLNGMNYTAGAWSSALIIRVNSAITSEIYVDVQGNNKVIGGNHGGIKFQGPSGAVANVHFWSSTGGQLEVGAQNSMSGGRYAYYQAERGIAVNYDVLAASNVSDMKVRNTSYDYFIDFMDAARNAGGRGSSTFKLSQAVAPSPLTLTKVADNQYQAVMPASDVNLVVEFVKRTTDVVSFSDGKFEFELLNADALADGSETTPSYNLWYDDVILDKSQFTLTRTNNNLATHKVTFTLSLNEDATYGMVDGSEESMDVEVAMPIRGITILNPETGETVKQIIANLGEEVTLPSAESRQGYNFTGWKYGDEVIADGATIVVADDMTVTPIYEARTDTAYTVEYYRETVGRDGYVMERKTLTGTTDTVAENLEQDYDGWTFDSTNPENVVSGTVTADGKLTLKYYYTINDSTVVFYDYDGTELFATDTEVDVLPEASAHDGYTFTYWYYDDGTVAEVPLATITPTSLHAAYDYSITVNGEPYTVNSSMTLGELKEEIADELEIRLADLRITAGYGAILADDDTTIAALGILSGTDVYAASDSAIFEAIAEFESRFSTVPKNTDSWKDVENLLWDIYDYRYENKEFLSEYEDNRLENLSRQVSELHFTLNDISYELGRLEIALLSFYPDDIFDEGDYSKIDRSRIADAATSEVRGDIAKMIADAKVVLADWAEYLVDSDIRNMNEVIADGTAMLERIDEANSALTNARTVNNNISLTDAVLDDEEVLREGFVTLSEFKSGHPGNFTEAELAEADVILTELNEKLDKLTKIRTLVDARGEIILNDTEGNYGRAYILNTPEELKTIIPFVNGERYAIMDGANALISLTMEDITDTIGQDEQNLIKSGLSGNDEVALYLNARLFREVDGFDKTEIYELDKPINISFQLPAELLAKLDGATEIYLIRNHEGEITKMPLAITDDIVSFETDRFSTYALAYTPVMASVPNTGLFTESVMGATASIASVLAVVVLVVAGVVTRAHKRSRKE